MTALILTDSSDELPLSIEELKLQSRLFTDTTDEDILLTGYIYAATDFVEKSTARDAMEKTWNYVLPCFSNPIRLPRVPVTDVASISYYDTDGSAVELEEGDFILIAPTNARAYLAPLAETCWPETQRRIDAVTITFTTGPDTTPSLIDCIRQIAADRYENREATSPIQMKEIPFGVQHEIERLRVK